MKRSLIFFSFMFILQRIHAPQFTITNPGLFTLGDDITYAPTSANDTIIQISASNVVLDLGNHILSQQAGNTQAGLTGITVAANNSGVTIQNGFINNLTGEGIIIASGCTRVQVDNIVTFSCDTRGIDYAGTSANPIINSFIRNCHIARCCQGISGDYALSCSGCQRFMARDIIINQCGSTGHDLSAARFDTCSNSEFSNITANGCFAGTNLRTFDFSSTSSCIFTNCVANSSTVANSGGLCIGYEFQTATPCVKNLFQACVALALNATGGGSATTVGFRLNNNSNNNVFENCKAIEGLATATSTGFQLTSNASNVLRSCIAQNNDCTTGQATGFLLNNTTSNKILQSIACDQTSTGGTAVGIDTNTDTTLTVLECLVSTNNGSAAATSFGIQQATGTSNLFLKNPCFRNGSTAGNQANGLAGGQTNPQPTTNINSLQAWTNGGIT